MRISSVEKVLSQNANTKVSFYFSRKEKGEDYDQYENNTTDVFENPISKKLYVVEFTPEALAWRVQGLSAKEGKLVVCDSKYENWFKYATKIEIEGIEYNTYAKGGGQFSITKRPGNLIRVILFRT